MSLITKWVSNIILLLIGITWAMLCLSKKELLPLPDTVLWSGAILFAGDKGIDIVVQKLGVTNGKKGN